MIEEVIVTALKRETTVLEVPASLVVFDRERLTAGEIETAGDLSRQTPGLVIGEISNAWGTAALYVRGVGSSVRGIGADPNVAVYQDDLYNPLATTLMQDFVDLQRVEVLRGPQGTLYGRNATGGAMNLVSAVPGASPGVGADITVGDYDLLRARAWLDGGNEAVSARLAVSRRHMDSFYHREPAPERGQADSWNAKGAVRFQPDANWTVTLRGHVFDDSNFADFALRTMPQGPIQALAGATPDSGDPFRYRSDLADSGALKYVGTGLHIDWAPSEVLQFQSISGWQHSETERLVDFDGTDVWVLNSGTRVEGDLLTQEFRLLSTPTSGAEWLAGAFFLDEDASQLNVGQFDGRFWAPLFALPPVTFIEMPLAATIRTRAWALFGEATWPIGDRGKLITGLRYSHERKTHHLTSNAITTNLFSVPGTETRDSVSWSQPTYRLVYEHNVRDRDLVYAGWSTGFKSGGFNSGGGGERFDEEELAAIEGGVKMLRLGGRLAANLSAFVYDYDNAQTTLFLTDPSDPTFGSVEIRTPDAESWGAELEVMAIPVDAVRLGLGLALLHTRITSDFVVDHPLGGTVNLKGSELPYAPRFSLNFSGSYALDFGSAGRLVPHVDILYQDDMYLTYFNIRDNPFTGEPDGGDYQSSYLVTNAFLDWHSRDARWSISLYAKNLTDETYLGTSSVSASFGSYRIWMPPRTVGIRLGFSL